MVGFLKATQKGTAAYLKVQPGSVHNAGRLLLRRPKVLQLIQGAVRKCQQRWSASPKATNKVLQLVQGAVRKCPQRSLRLLHLLK